MVLQKLSQLDLYSHGKGDLLMSWNWQGTLLATVGARNNINISDPFGNILLTVPLRSSPPKPVLQLEWDNDGTVLAVLQAGLKGPALVSAETKETMFVETKVAGGGSVTTMAWSRTGPQLFLGASTGQLFVYDLSQRQMVVLASKTNKKIAAAAWSNHGQLAFSSEDKCLSVSVPDENDFNKFITEGVGRNIQWTCRTNIKKAKQPLAFNPLQPRSVEEVHKEEDDEVDDSENTVSMMLHQSNTLLVKAVAGNIMANFLQLGFQPKYGAIRGHGWFDDHLVVGFSNGYIIIAAIQANELSQGADLEAVSDEIAVMRAFDYDNSLNDLKVSRAIGKVAVVGERKQIRLFDVEGLTLSESRSEQLSLGDDFGPPTKMSWSEDGSILSVASKIGNVLTALTRIPLLAATDNSSSLVYYSDFRALTLCDFTDGVDDAVNKKIHLEFDPSFLAISEDAVAGARGNEFWIGTLDHEAMENPQNHNHTIQMSATLMKQTRGGRNNTTERPLVSHWETLEYPEAVTDIRLANEFCAVLLESGVSVLRTLVKDDPSRPQRQFPMIDDQSPDDEDDDSSSDSSGDESSSDDSEFDTFKKPTAKRNNKSHNSIVTCHGMSNEVYIAGSNTGLITIYSLLQSKVIQKYQHKSAAGGTVGIRRLIPNPTGTLICWIDDDGRGYILNSAHPEKAALIRGFAPSTTDILWDPEDFNTFVGVDDVNLCTYTQSWSTSLGFQSKVVTVPGKSNVPVRTQRPQDMKLVLYTCDGSVGGLRSDGSRFEIPLQTHAAIVMGSGGGGGGGDATMMFTTTANGSATIMGATVSPLKGTVMAPKKAGNDAFHLNLELGRLSEAASHVTTADEARELAEKALDSLELNIAIAMYTKLGQMRVVKDLKKVQLIKEDRNQILGHLSVFRKDYDAAEKLFMQCRDPMLAVQMRRDLSHWDRVWPLAEKVVPEKLPILKKEAAQQAEFKGKYKDALRLFEGALCNDSKKIQSAASLEIHNSACHAGVARCHARLGDIFEGMKKANSIAADVENAEARRKIRIRTQLQVAQILVDMKQFKEAAEMYEKTESYYDLAALVHIDNLKNLDQAKRLIQLEKSGSKKPTKSSTVHDFMEDENVTKPKGPLIGSAMRQCLSIRNMPVLKKYAKASEINRSYAEACSYYEAAGDWDSVIRLKMQKTDEYSEAVSLIMGRDSFSASQGVPKPHREVSRATAEIVANEAKKKGETATAIHFLLVAGNASNAFHLAKASSKLYPLFFNKFTSYITHGRSKSGSPLFDNAARIASDADHRDIFSKLAAYFEHNVRLVDQEMQKDGNAAQSKLSSNGNLLSDPAFYSSSLHLAVMCFLCAGQESDAFDLCLEHGARAEKNQFSGSNSRPKTLIDLTIDIIANSRRKANKVLNSKGGNTFGSIEGILTKSSGGGNKRPTESPMAIRLVELIKKSGVDLMYQYKLYVTLLETESQTAPEKTHIPDLIQKIGEAALMVSTRYLGDGSYKEAHSILLDASSLLSKYKAKAPEAMRDQLYLLHSYLIVKHLSGNLDDGVLAARMLIRVAERIETFPAKHRSTIMTTCVMQCLKSDFKASAQRFSKELLTNDVYKKELAEKHKSKMEQTLRKIKPSEAKDPHEAKTACPHCNADVPETQLVCNDCKKLMPMCIVTGKHMDPSNLTECPSCHFPALHSACTTFRKLHNNSDQPADALRCPMCTAVWGPSSSVFEKRKKK